MFQVLTLAFVPSPESDNVGWCHVLYLTHSANCYGEGILPEGFDFLVYQSESYVNASRSRAPLGKPPGPQLTLKRPIQSHCAPTQAPPPLNT